MGKFSNYVDNIREQTNSLRKALNMITGENYSKASIETCSQAIKKYVDPSKESFYSRPDHYPLIKEIINNAPILEKDGIEYYPGYICIERALRPETYFFKNSVSDSSSPAYDRHTGGDAVLCSDICENIENASSEMLEIGEEIIHKWDPSKDFRADKKDGVRWFIVYTKNKDTIVTAEMMISVNIIESVTKYISIKSPDQYSYDIKYLEFQPETLLQWTTWGFSSLYSLQKAIFNSRSATNSSPYYALQYAYSLEYLKLGDGVKTCGSVFGRYTTRIRYLQLSNSLSSLGGGFLRNSGIKELIIPEGVKSIWGASILSDACSLERLILPAGLETIGSSISSGNSAESVSFSGLHSLKYLKLPETLKKIVFYPSTFGSVKYFELWDNFDIDGVCFSQCEKLPEWLKDLCIWLCDKTGEEPNSILLGSKNIALANSIYLTFDPENKRDITWVSKETEGAINIVQFITEQLNWTLS